MSIRLHHAGIVVPDLESAITFYSEFLGLKEDFRFAWDESDREDIETVIDLSESAASAVMLEGDGYHLELFEYRAPSSTVDPSTERACDSGIRHLAFEVSDIEEACGRFLRAGGTLHHAPVPLGNSLCIYGRDPFGNIIELMQPIEDVDPLP